MSVKLKLAFIVLVIAAGILYLGTFTVQEGHQALLFDLGKITQSNLGPGLHFKIPLIEQERVFDHRLRTYESDSQSILTNNQKNVVLGYIVLWRIKDAMTYYSATHGNLPQAELHLSQTINGLIRKHFSGLSLNQLLEADQGPIMEAFQKQARAALRSSGIDVIAIRIKTLRLPTDSMQAIYDQMKRQRNHLAAQYIAKGKAEAETIRAQAKLERVKVLTHAYKKAQALRAEGDLEASRTYVKNYAKNPRFYALYERLRIYREGFLKGHNLLVLEPELSSKQFSNQSRQH